MSPIYLAADKNKGIFKIDPIDFPNMVLMKPRVYLDLFKSINDGELVFTVIDPILNRKRIRHFLELIECYGGEGGQESENPHSLVANLPQAETGTPENR